MHATTAGQMTAAPMALIPGRWRGPAEQPLGMAALLVLTVVGMEITGLQPILFGALVAEGRLTSAQLGLATTAEFLTLAGVLGLAGALLKPQRLRLIALIAASVMLMMDLLVLRLSGPSIIAVRAVAGIAEGLLVWMPACMVARSPHPAFWSSVSLTLQCATQLLFAATLPVTLMVTHGANGGFAALAATAGAVILAIPFLPNSFAPLTDGHEGHRVSPVPGPAGIFALCAVFLLMAFAIGLFAYLGLLATEAGLSQTTLAIAVSTVLGAEIVGGIAASFAARRLRYFSALIICLAAYAIVIFTLQHRLGATPFILTGALFGFFQVFLMPFQLPLVIEADPTRRAAVILPGVQLLGGASGPFICSFFVTAGDSRGALTACGGFLILAFALIATLNRRLKR